jgi:hypothetical protein
MRRSTLGTLRQQHRQISAPARAVPRLEIALDVAGDVIGPGQVTLEGHPHQVGARIVRDGLLYLALAVGAGTAELVLDDAGTEWDGTLPGREVLLVGAVQDGRAHLHGIVAQRPVDAGLAAAPVRTVAELLAEALGVHK